MKLSSRNWKYFNFILQDLYCHLTHAPKNFYHFHAIQRLFYVAIRITKLAHYWLQRGNKCKGATDPILSVYLKQGDIKVR